MVGWGDPGISVREEGEEGWEGQSDFSTPLFSGTIFLT